MMPKFSKCYLLKYDLVTVIVSFLQTFPVRCFTLAPPIEHCTLREGRFRVSVWIYVVFLFILTIHATYIKQIKQYINTIGIYRLTQINSKIDKNTP